MTIFWLFAKLNAPKDLWIYNMEDCVNKKQGQETSRKCAPP